MLKNTFKKQIKTVCLLMVLLSINAVTYGQTKKEYTDLHELKELNDCNYILATVKKGNKMADGEQCLLFINAQDGETTQIDLPKDTYIKSANQVQIKEKDVNLVKYGQFEYKERN